MSTDDRDDPIRDLDALRERYGAPNPRAIAKVCDRLDERHRRVLAASPFFVLSTVGEGGTDASPRGGPPGILRALDDHTVAFPDHRGNRRLDSLQNIVEDGRVALLIFIPGSNETLRINGTARVCTGPALLARVDPEHPPLAAVVVDIQEVYHHCARALMRAKLWDPGAWPTDAPRVTQTPDTRYTDRLYGPQDES